MKTREFLENLPDLVRQQLPPELGGFEVMGPAASLVKLHYGQASVHYEVWVRRRQRQVEVALHFEGGRESNLRGLELLRDRSEDISASLGPDVRLEEWDKGWTRAYEALPLEPLTDDFLIEVSFSLSGMMRVLEPLLRAAPPG